MHFSKTYAQLLLSLPPELRDNAIEYRKLKKLINQTVSELDSLGFGPSVLQSLHNRGRLVVGPAHSKEQDATSALAMTSQGELEGSYKPAIAYEIAFKSTLPEPRLRLSFGHPSDAGTHRNSSCSMAQPIYHVDLCIPEQLLSHVMQAQLHPPIANNTLLLTNSEESDPCPDLIIPLPSDTAFFQLLTSTLCSLSGHFDSLYTSFNSTLATLAGSISLTARPASSSAPRSFSAYSLTANNASTLRPNLGGKSDLYTWREIFRLYAEAEVFETFGESTRGERSVEEAERRLTLFEGLIQETQGSLFLPGSRAAFDEFMTLNMFILDVKKFELANSEATRKILKKHTKRTTLLTPFSLLERNGPVPATFSSQVALITRPSEPLPRLLVQAVGEVLLPIVPHIDDYSCLICTCIAFKPIRLRCGHFFCVRCLTKLQKRGRANCPMCRAPTVLRANPSNIDYGLLNFMADWFPIESREKLRANEREVTQEQLEEFGLSGGPSCLIM